MDPQQAQALQAAQAAFQRGQRSEGKRILTNLLTRAPHLAEGWFMLGVVAMETGDSAGAVEKFDRALQSDPRHAWSLFHCIRLARASGNLNVACTRAEALLAAQPNDRGVLMEAGMALYQGMRFAAAADCFRLASAVPQVRNAAQFWLAITLKELGRMSESRRILRSVAPLSGASEPFVRLAEAEIFFGDTDLCVAACRNALKSDPKCAPAYETMARAFAADGKMDMAREAWSKAESVAPRPSAVMTQQGYVLQSLGDFQGAEAAFQRAIEAEPLDGNPYALWVHIRPKATNNGELIKQIRDCLEKSPSPASRRHFFFALAKLYHDSGDYEAAMKHYDLANALTTEVVFGGHRPDPGTTLYHSQLLQALTPESLAKLAERGDPDSRPTFVLGMIRSGTTFLEQVIAAHPEVVGAGELGFWQIQRNALLDASSGRVNEPALRRAAAEYKELLTEIGSGASRVVDKNPPNFSVAGLIHAAFPNARILAMRRNPVDVALSIWTTNMATRAPFVGDKRKIVDAVREMERVTDAWKDLIPADRYRIVRYEDMAIDREGTSRSVIEFLGLSPAPQAVNAQKNRREILTPSFWQVRQPAYTSSIDRWRVYGPWLGEFAELLEPA